MSTPSSIEALVAQNLQTLEWGVRAHVGSLNERITQLAELRAQAAALVATIDDLIKRAERARDVESESISRLEKAVAIASGGAS